VSVGPYYEGLHPWDDPSRIRPEWHGSLQRPHPSVDPHDFRTFQDYQEALAAQHEADHEVPRSSGKLVRHIRSRDLDSDDLTTYAIVALVLFVAICMGVGWLAYGIYAAGSGIYETIAGPSPPPSSVSQEYQSESGGVSPRASAPPTDEVSTLPQGSGVREGSGEFDAESTVRAYYDAINRRDYNEAWSLGGMNLSVNRSRFIRDTVPPSTTRSQ
jgi:hypothetical protein